MAADPTSAKRTICIHGHFYQPPRENPWLEAIEIQDTAAPYHDWNDRITAECYAPNGAARIVNDKNQIIRIVNNYSRISFNFGPTLLSWLEEKAPRTYRMIREGDRQSILRYGGHGSALAQVYNHVIMPLANTRDRITQIEWGIADFEHRFGRKPEGMWLAETAVDLETLELLAEHDILFTILAPHQCARIRQKAESLRQPVLPELNTAVAGWTDTPQASVDSTRPYHVHLQSGRRIVVFFYNGPVSRAIAFEGLLNSGEAFAARLNGIFSPTSETAQLAHVATDGESYGHHHRHGEMALAYALKLIEDQPLAVLTNYGQFLASNPPTWEAEIVEDSSWSCLHGIERWRSDCGCNGGHAGWNQQWRGPLRSALDWLRDTLAPYAERAAQGLLNDLWAARNAYIRVMLSAAHQREDAIDQFFRSQALGPLSFEERIRLLKLMEMQRNSQLMYTSCGWFFDEISGIETVQVIAYAARALELARDLPGFDLASVKGEFLERLRQAKSNVPEYSNGGEIYRLLVEPLQVTLEQVAAHFAISSVFRSYPEEATLFCYTIRRHEYQILTSGRGSVALGQVEITSNITGESDTVWFAALHFGDQNVTAAVKQALPQDLAAFEVLKLKCDNAVAQANLPEVVRLIDGFFGGSPYSLASLFRDDQRQILHIILKSTVGEVESSLAGIYQEHASLLHFLSASGLPKPPALTVAAGFAINAAVRQALESEPIDAARVQSLIALAKADRVELERQGLSYLVDQRMKRAMVELQAKPLDFDGLDRTFMLARTVRELPFELNLWQAQNIWYDTLRGSVQFLVGLEPFAQERWRERFLDLGRQLWIAVEHLVVEDEEDEQAQSARANSPKALSL